MCAPAEANKGDGGSFGTIEIERKFLLISPPAELDDLPSCEIEQGYLVVTHDFEARLRRKDAERYLTVKQGCGRARRETEVSLSEAQFDALWPLTEGRRVEKRRYFHKLDGVTIEYDVYSGKLEGLCVAEIEFPSVELCDAFTPPKGLGREVTGDSRYANKNLAMYGAPDLPV